MKSLYDMFFRPHMPRKLATLNGVAVYYPRLFDQRDDWPHWETSLCKGIQKVVKGGDRVLLIGGGHGVSTVHASQAAGSNGGVVTYEAVGELAGRVSETVERNITPADVSVRHAAVAEVSDWSTDAHGPADGKVVSPKDLPEADVAVLDCEGAEIEILPALTNDIDRLVVETHGFLGSPTEEIRTILEESGYTVSKEGAEDPDKDVYILVANSQSGLGGEGAVLQDES